MAMMKSFKIIKYTKGNFVVILNIFDHISHAFAATSLIVNRKQIIYVYRI